ncbi:MAG: A24 family peptidase [Planctomycetaceae bacterium]
MFELSTSQSVFLAAVVIYTTIAAISDYRFRKIPNKLTVPMCVAGLVYQIGFFGLAGLQTALLGFLVGFGILFALWMIGSAGGGDVKLMGGLSVWLGASLSLKVLFTSLLFVAIGTMVMMLGSIAQQGFRKTRTQYLKNTNEKKSGETLEQKSKRRVMAFAMPVAFATWSVLALFRNQW